LISESLGVVGPECDRPLVALDRLGEAPKLGESDAAIVEGLAVTGVQRSRARVACDRLVEPSQRAEHVAVLGEGDRMIGCERQDTAIARKRRLQLAELLERVAAIEQRVDIIRRETDGPVVALDRFAVAHECGQRGPAVVVRGRGGRIDLQGGIDLANGRNVLAALVMDDADQMQSVEMPRLDRQDPAVERLGLGQSAGLMQAQRLLEERRDPRPRPRVRRLAPRAAHVQTAVPWPSA